MDFNGSFLARVRDLVGANPIILVVTKVILFLRVICDFLMCMCFGVKFLAFFLCFIIRLISFQKKLILIVLVIGW